jgi:hypothetical protein
VLHAPVVIPRHQNLQGVGCPCHIRCAARPATKPFAARRTFVRYPVAVTERPRLALRQPRSLQPEQLGNLPVSTPTDPARVLARVLWEDGVEELTEANAVAWTKRAVKVSFGAPPHQHDGWVWAGAVERT